MTSNEGIREGEKCGYSTADGDPSRGSTAFQFKCPHNYGPNHHPDSEARNFCKSHVHVNFVLRDSKLDLEIFGKEDEESLNGQNIQDSTRHCTDVNGFLQNSRNGFEEICGLRSSSFRHDCLSLAISSDVFVDKMEAGICFRSGKEEEGQGGKEENDSNNQESHPPSTYPFRIHWSQTDGF